MVKKRQRAPAKRLATRKKPEPPDAIDLQIGLRIRARRMAQRMTQVQLGAAIERSWQQVFKYERGRDHIRAAMLARIAKVLRAPPGYFFGNGNGDHETGIEHELPAGDPQLGMLDFLATKDGQALVDNYRRISDSRIAAAVGAFVAAIAALA